MLGNFLVSPQRVLNVVMVALLLLVPGVLIFQTTKVELTFVTDDGERVVATHADTVEALLRSENIDVSENDVVIPNLQTTIEEGMTVTWHEAKPVTIRIDDDVQTVETTETIVENILQQANITVTTFDNVSIALDSEIDSTRRIDVSKAFELELLVGKEQQTVSAPRMAVGEFLQQQGVSLGVSDRVNYELTAMIEPNMKIEVIQVEKEKEVVTETLPYSIEEQLDDTLLKGQKKVVTKGVAGQRTVTYEIVKENGEPVVKTIVNEQVMKEPVTEVVVVGYAEPKPKPAPVVVSAEPVKQEAVTSSATNVSNTVSIFGKVDKEPQESKQELMVEATAYTPFCDGCLGITKTGLNVRVNTDIKVIAVDPRIIPLGTKVWVEGYGYAIAADIGGDIKNHRIDILVHSKMEAFKWGRRQVRVKIL